MLVPEVLVLVLDPEALDDVSVSEVLEDSELVSGIGVEGAGAGSGVPDTAGVACGFGLGLGGAGAVMTGAFNT
jgi:hypothetical protein